MLRAPLVGRWDPVDGAGAQAPIRLIAGVGGPPGRGAPRPRPRRGKGGSRGSRAPSASPYLEAVVDSLIPGDAGRL